MPERMLDRMSDAECQNGCLKRCQIEWQNRCQIECQNECLTRYQKKMSKYVPESLSEYMPERGSDRMSGRMPERMSIYYIYIYCNICFQMVCQKLCQHSLSGSASLEEFNVQSSLVHMMCRQPRKPTMKSKWPRLHRAWAKQHKATRLKGPQLFPPFSWSRQNADFLLRSNFHLRRGP